MIIVPLISSSTVLSGSSSFHTSGDGLSQSGHLASYNYHAFSCSSTVMTLLIAQITWHCVVGFHLPHINS